MKSLLCALFATVASFALAIGFLVDAVMLRLGAFEGSLLIALFVYGTTNFLGWYAGVWLAAAAVPSADRRHTVAILVGAVFILFAIRTAAAWHADLVRFELFLLGGVTIAVASTAGIFLGPKFLRRSDHQRQCAHCSLP